MSIENVARKILPAKALASLRRTKRKIQRQRIAALPPIGEAAFNGILVRDLRLAPGDTVYVHSSIDQLNLDFPFYRILPLIQDVIGQHGTVLFPTYPNHQISSYDYLKQGKVFDVKRTPSYTGILTELARRQHAAVRSLHPTKSVCAIGKYANELTGTHQLSPYPYDTCSPYFKLVDYRAKIIGLGVWTQYLSFVYCVDDALKEKFPVRVYHPEVFEAQCRNYNGQIEMVKTFVHNMANVVHDVPAMMRKYIAPDICEDLKINGMRFFRANAAALFSEMMQLAQKGITVYADSVYEKRGR
jgi:aminoglycoside N3'-acetyltransferase